MLIFGQFRTVAAVVQKTEIPSSKYPHRVFFAAKAIRRRDQDIGWRPSPGFRITAAASHVLSVSERHICLV
jgi:hypothetical protein